MFVSFLFLFDNVIVEVIVICLLIIISYCGVLVVRDVRVVGEEVENLVDVVVEESGLSKW